jgi:predicted dehydrogenase
MVLPGLKLHPRAEVIAICGRNEERARELASKYEIPTVFTEYRAMLSQSGLDAVAIVVPDDLHYSMTMDALDTGLHVLCEKPLALNANDARKMYQRAEQVGVKHAVFYTYRWFPQFRFMHDLIRQGVAGHPFQADLQFRMGVGRDGRYNWRVNKHRANGVIGDLGSHLFDLTRWLVGEVSAVSANLGMLVEHALPENEPYEPSSDSAVAALKFANGAQGTIQTSVVTKVLDGFMRLEVEYYGAKGTLEANNLRSNTVRHGSFSEEEPSSIPVPDEFWGAADRDNPFDVLSKNSAGARLFVDSILEDRAISPNFYDGWQAQRLIDAAIESDASGRWVSISPAE